MKKLREKMWAIKTIPTKKYPYDSLFFANIIGWSYKEVRGHLESRNPNLSWKELLAAWFRAVRVEVREL